MSTKITCPRCSGVGRLDHFKHIENGICFLCGGKKEIFIKDFFIKDKELVCCYQDNRNITKTLSGEKYPNEFRHEWMIITVNGNKGTEWQSQIKITDENRQACRELWNHCKSIGADMRSLK